MVRGVIYALVSILVALALLGHRVAHGGGTFHLALVVFLCLCAAFTAGCYAAKWSGGEPEGYLDGAGRGTRAMAALFLAPYSLIALVVLFVEHRLWNEDFANQAAPHLFVGRLPTPWDRHRVAALGLEAVLNMCLEFPDLMGVPLARHRIPVLDGTAPSVARLRDAVAWCQGHRAAGRSVLVHCAHGHGRSALVAAAVLLASGQASDPQQALEQLRAARPGVNVSPRQRAALEAYEASRQAPQRPRK